jgi:hypothetical protein
MRVFETPDGVRWGVQVKVPGASNVMVVFHHPNGLTARLDRYAWENIQGPSARDVTARLKASEALEKLSEADIARLFRRSMKIAAASDPLQVPITTAA